MPIQVAAGNGLDAVHAFGALGQSLYGKALTSGHSLAWQFGGPKGKGCKPSKDEV